MRKQDVITHFGSQRAVAKALQISDAAVSQWRKIIPEKDAYRLELITHGQLKHQECMYRKTQGNNALRGGIPPIPNLYHYIHHQGQMTHGDSLHAGAKR